MDSQMDALTVASFIREFSNRSNTQDLRLGTGVVNSITVNSLIFVNTISVIIGAKEIFGIKILDGYHPKVGDVAILVYNNSTMFALGRLDNGTANDTAWITPTLSGGWSSLGGATVQYRRFNGRTYLQGLLAGGTLSSVAFNLPVGFRPLFTSYFPTDANKAFGEVIVELNGDVYPRTGSTTWQSLHGINLIAEG